MPETSSCLPLVLRKDSHLVLAVYNEHRNTLTEVTTPIRAQREGVSRDAVHRVSADDATTSGRYSGDYRECDIRFHPVDGACFAHATTTHLRYTRVQAVDTPTAIITTASKTTSDDCAHSFQLVTLFEMAMPHVVIDLAFSPCGSYLITYALMDAKRTPDGNMSIYDVATGQLLRRSMQARWPALAWTADENYVVRPVSGVMQVLPGSITAAASAAATARTSALPTATATVSNNTQTEQTDDSKETYADDTTQNADETADRPDTRMGHSTASLSTIDLALPHDKEIAFAVSPCASLPMLALFRPHHKQRQSSLSVYRLPDARRAVLLEAFFGRAEGASLYFSPSGSALAVLVKTERDSSGKSYYGTVRLHLVDILQRSVKEVKLSGGVANDTVHDCAWSPTQDELLVVHGKMPCNRVTLYDKKGVAIMSFGEAPRNVALWSPNAMSVVLGGSGNLAGDYQFYERRDATASTRLSSSSPSRATASTSASTASASAPARCTGQFNEKSSTQQWCPDSHHFLCATVFSRLRVDNKVVILKNNGARMTTVRYPLLYGADWVRMRDSADYPQRPASPMVDAAAATGAASPTTSSAISSAGGGAVAAGASQPGGDGAGEAGGAKSQIYRPPGGTSARLAALLRRPNAGAMNTTATAAKPAGTVGATVVVSKKKKKK